jgi:ribosomal protein S7
MIAEGFARLARDDRFKSNPLSVVRSLVDHNLAPTVSVRDLIGEFAKQRPVQARERRVVEMALDNRADVGEVTIAMCRGLVELTTAAHGTIAVVVGMAHEFPLVRHFGILQ